MKKLFANLQNLKTQAGFTMIELLIVIAILGILAVAVLSAINPIEQINRGRDTGSRSDAEQLLSAIDRFNAFQGYFPWQDGASDDEYQIITGGVSMIPWVGESSVVDHQTPTACQVSDLLSATNGVCVGSGELKVSFFTRILDEDYNHLSIYHDDQASDSTYICFEGKSDAFITEAKERCGSAGGDMPSDMSNIIDEVCNDTGSVWMTCLP